MNCARGSFLPGHVLQPAIACQSSIELLAADGADHGAGGCGRIVRPEQAQDFAGIVMEADTGALFFAQGLAIFQSAAPAQDGEAQIEFGHEKEQTKDHLQTGRAWRTILQES